MKTYDEKIFKLLIKSLTGVLTPDERVELDTWLEDDPANVRLYARLGDRDYMTLQWRLWLKTSNDDSWREMRRRMARVRFMSAVRRRWWIPAVAAAIVGVLLIPGVLSVPEDASVIARRIMPPDNEAVIELENGEVIALNDSKTNISHSFRSMGRMVGDSILDYSSLSVASLSRPVTHTVRVPEGSKVKQVVLSDGSSVWLNAGSSLVFPVVFDGGSREVSMTGEGYFEVEANRDAPFIVRTQGISVRVTGTRFNLMSYSGDRGIETTLVEGRVDVVLPGRDVSLSAGSQAVFDKDRDQVTVRQVDTSIYTAWKEGMFEFQDMPISNICLVLSRWYDIEFSTSSPEVGNSRFTGSIGRNKSLGFILDLIRDTENIDYTIKDGHVTITNQ